MHNYSHKHQTSNTHNTCQPQKNIIWPYSLESKLQTLPEQQTKHLATPTIHMLKSTHERLHIARHNNVIHQIVHTLLSNAHPHLYTLVNARTHNAMPQDVNPRMGPQMHIYHHPMYMHL